MAKNKKKILFLITKSNFGGAQRYVYDLAKNLPKGQFDIAVALGGDGLLGAKLVDANIKVIKIPDLQRNISVQKELQAFGQIRNIIKQEVPDILHVNSSKAGGLGALAGRLLGVNKVIYTAHGWAFNEDRSGLGRWAAKFFHWLTILLSHRTITVSNALKNQMKWPGTQHKMTTVYNGRAIPQHLSRAKARKKLSQLCPALSPYRLDFWTGTIAELHPTKNHELMIEAVAKLVASGHQLRHLIIGSGEKANELKDLVQEKKLTENIFFLGHLDEAAKYLKALDIFTLTSISEALGYTIIEAANAELPIVATRVGGIPEIITSGQSGYLVNSGDHIKLAETLARLIDNQPLRLETGQNAKIRVRAFSLTKMLENTMSVYNS